MRIQRTNQLITMCVIVLSLLAVACALWSRNSDNLVRAEDQALAAAGSNAVPGTPESLRGDSLRLGRILTNFATNAVKFNQAVLQPLFTPEAWEQLRKDAQDYCFNECQTLAEQAVAVSSTL